MPNITDKEFELFQELLKREDRRQKEEKHKKELSIKDLTEKVENFLHEYKSYGSIEAFALYFSRYIDKSMKASNLNMLFFSWTDIKRYLTNRCLDHDRWGNLKLKKSFREHLKKRGFKTFIKRKYDTFKISRCEPKKVVNK